MHASNKPQPPTSWRPSGMPHEAVAAVQALWSGSAGRTVRCVPSRRTVVVELERRWLFAKWRRGHLRAAAAEWHWLHVLPLLGVRTAVPLCWIGGRRRSLLVTDGVAGRSLDAWAVEASAGGWLPHLVAYVCRFVAPAVRRLHDHGLVYRDLYWNHVFALDPRGSEPPVFLDVERVVRPRLLWRRWVVKDLAGLLASAPVEVAPRWALRFLRAYLREPLRGHRGEMLAVAAKARRIQQHVPRFG